MLTIWWYRLLDFLQVQWRKYKTTLIWLLVWLVAGIVLGVITLIVSDVGVNDINYHLIDGNLLNASSTNSSLGNFIWQRILSIVFPVSVVLIFALISRWTMGIIFPVILIHGYWLAIAVWWTFFYYNLTAILLLVFYTLWLLVVTAIILAGLLWALQCGENFRNCRNSTEHTRQHHWGVLFRGSAILIGLAVVLGFMEYLVFWTILGKIVYKPR